MRKPAPCKDCPNSGQLHNRCESFQEWKKCDLEYGRKVNAEKHKYSDWHNFRKEVFK